MAAGDTPEIPTTATPVDFAQQNPGLVEQVKLLREQGVVVDQNTTFFDKLGHVLHLTTGQLHSLIPLATGVGKAFENMSSGGSRGLATFTGQFDALKNAVAQGGSAAEDLKKKFNFGSGITGMFGSIAGALAMAADNQIRLQNAMMQGTVAAGDSGDMYDKVGTHLNHLGDITERQQKAMLDAGKATKGVFSPEQISMYTAELLKIPGGFGAMQEGARDASGNTNILAQVMKFATGAGRDEVSVMKDMKQAVAEMGVSTNIALQFTARATEIANKFGAQIDDVTKALSESVSAFSMFSRGGDDAKTMLDGLAQGMNKYVGSLESVGIPAQNAIKLSKELALSAANLDVAHAAFLSRQSGGPGGLQGAAQIEMMKRDHPEKVMELIQKQFLTLARVNKGDQLTTVKDVAEGRGSGSQLQKERSMIQMTYGAKDQKAQDAIIEAIHSGKEMPPNVAKELKDPAQSLQDIVSQGNDILAQSHTVLGDIYLTLQENNALLGKNSLERMKRILAESGGKPGQSTAAQRENQDLLKRGSGLGSPHETIQKAVENDFKKIGKELPATLDSLKLAFSAVIKNFKSGKPENTEKLDKQLQEKIAAAREANKKLPENKQQAANAMLETVDHDRQSIYQQSLKPLAGTGQNDVISNMKQANKQSDNSLFDPIDKLPLEQQPAARAAGHQVGAAARAAQSQAEKHAGGPGGSSSDPRTVGGGATNTPVPVVLAHGSSLTVNFSGTCPHCGTRYSSSEHAVTGNPAAANKAGY